MSIFGDKSGSYWVHSDIDPRWNKSFRTDNLVFSNGIPEAGKQWIENCKEQFGNKPSDLSWGGIKD